MVIEVDLLFRGVTLVIFFFWWLYWAVTENEANREKPKAEPTNDALSRQHLQRWFLRFAQILVFLQLIGLSLLELPWRPFVPQAIGFVLVLIGVSVAVSARKTLGTNWAHAVEFQVKKKQELVTSGVYGFIRHPIYAGLCLAFIGGELVAQSYLAIAGVVVLIVGYYQARREEKLLISHFGNAYKSYMKRTKMFIPFLW